MIFGSRSYNQILLFHFFFAELQQNLTSFILMFLVICSSQDMGNCEIIPFAVPSQNKMKIVKSTISDIVENVKDKFESCPGFPQQFRLQFEHQDCHIFVDLDEPVQPLYHSSNADDKADDADKNASITNSFESDDTL